MVKSLTWYCHSGCLSCSVLDRHWMLVFKGFGHGCVPLFHHYWPIKCLCIKDFQLWWNSLKVTALCGATPCGWALEGYIRERTVQSGVPFLGFGTAAIWAYHTHLTVVQLITNFDTLHFILQILAFIQARWFLVVWVFSCYVGKVLIFFLCWQSHFLLCLQGQF